MRARSAPAEASRDRIIEAAAALLAEGGRDAVSTRAVSAAAGVQAPTIYRIFGDKRGLLDAVTSDAIMGFIQAKTTVGASDDPVEDLRQGWDRHVGFGVAHPAVYSLIYGEPEPGAARPAAIGSARALHRHITRLAEAGRLRVDEGRAVQVIYAACTGTTLTMIGLPDDRRDPVLSDVLRDAAIAAIVTDEPIADAPGPVHAAVALRAVLNQTEALSAQESALLREWLDRIAHSAT